MKRILLATTFISTLSWLYLTSCQHKSKNIHIPMFKGMEMFMTKNQFNSYSDSMTKYDPAFNVVRNENKKYLEFTEVADNGITYKGYVLPTFTNGIVTKLTIFYTPSSNPDLITGYYFRDEQPLTYWGDAANKVQNDINLKLQIKYGPPITTGSTVSSHSATNYIYLYNEWKKDDLSVKLLQEVEKDDGSNKFPFCNYLVDYSPTEEFQKKNKPLIDETIRNTSIY